MGNCAVARISDYVDEDPAFKNDTDKSRALRSVSKYRVDKIPLDMQVAHYMPATFPLVSSLNMSTIAACRHSWNIVINKHDLDPNGRLQTHGMTLFYNEFYRRLEQVDSLGRIEQVLARRSSGKSSISAKGSLIIRIVRYMLNMDNTVETIRSLRNCGKSHRIKGIRPWQYSVFMEVLLQTIGHRLNENATLDVMDAWVNLSAFSLAFMLPTAIEGRVVETEAAYNYDMNFHPEDKKNMYEVMNGVKPTDSQFPLEVIQRDIKDNVQVATAVIATHYPTEGDRLSNSRKTSPRGGCPFHHEKSVTETELFTPE
jgi:hemoglobin-like flavoprotein